MIEFENKYFTFFCGHDLDDIFKISFGINFQKFLLGIMFCPHNWNKIYKTIEGKRFQNKEIQHIYNISVFQFHYFDYTGTDIIHIIYDEEKIYYGTSSGLKQFKVYLRDKFTNPYSKINFNYSQKPSGNYIYYLTLKNDFLWFNENFINCLYGQRYPDCYLTSEEIKYYFPEYNKDWVDNKPKEIPYKKIDIYENES